MLTYVGEATNDIFDTLSNTGTDYDSAVQSLTQRFDPARNKDMEIYEFRQITQASGETLNEFYRRLKEKASTCEFASEESETRTQIIHKTSDTHLRCKALREEMDLKALLAYGLALEQSDRHSKVLEEDSNLPRQTNFIKGKTGLEHKKGHNPQGRNTRYNVPAKPSTHKCRNCGGSYPHIGGKSSCPAVQMAKSALNVGKLDILENIVYQNNGDKHVNHNQMNTNTHNNVIPEKKFVVCLNINKVTLTHHNTINENTRNNSHDC